MGAHDGNLKQLACSEEGMFLRFLFVQILVTRRRHRSPGSNG
jgi:hypothetical protein